MSPLMKMKYWINPSARKTDMEKKMADGKNIARNNKYDPDPEDLATNYLWTWKQIKKQFSVLMQDINKVSIITSLLEISLLCTSRQPKSLVQLQTQIFMTP